MRDAELWARIDRADFGPADVLDPNFRGVPKNAGEARAKGIALTMTSVPRDWQPANGLNWTPQTGKPLSVQYKAAILLELKRFLYLLAISHESLVPSAYVASALTQFQSQCDDLVRSIGQGQLTCDPPRSRLVLGRAWTRTLALRSEEFGPDDPEHIWPKALSLKLQVLGWGALVVGFGLVVMDQLGDSGTSLWALPFLALGGFLWAAEGPWPLDLPFRRSFMASLRP